MIKSTEMKKKPEQICPIHKIKMIPYIRDDAEYIDEEYKFFSYEDYYCPKCEKRIK